VSRSEPDAPHPPPPEPEEPADPGLAAVSKYLFYTCSLPERALRATAGLVGGAIKHSAELLVPQAFQDSRSYDIFVKQLLDFVIQDVGGVAKEPPPPGKEVEPEVENYVARKAVGNFVDLAGMATLHMSPVIVLALVSDMAYGSKTYLRELSSELKKEGIIDEQSTIDGAGDLLDAISHASGGTAQQFATPPISVDGLKKTIQETQQAVGKIRVEKTIPRGEVERMWKEMHEIASKENVSLLQVSTAMTLHTLGRIGKVGQGALSTARVAGNMFDRHIVGHYRDAITDIHQKGYYTTLAETAGPYITALWANFLPRNETVTEGIVSGRYLADAFGAVRGWLGRKKAANEKDTPDDSPRDDGQGPADSSAESEA